MAPLRPRILCVRSPADEGPIGEAARALAAGEAVVLPTETVYGVAAHPGVPGALERLFAIKGRDRDKPIAFLADSLERIERDGVALTPVERALARAFWPGPLTLVLTAPGGGREGFRVPACDVALALLRASGGLLRVTSANLSGEPPALEAAQAVAALGSAVAVVLDAGRVVGGVPSTVVQVEGENARVLREGALTREQIEQAGRARAPAG